jgi:hypothetical protein
MLSPSLGAAWFAWQIGPPVGFCAEPHKPPSRIPPNELTAAYGRAGRASPPGGRGGARVDDKTEMALLSHLIPQQRPRVPVRKLLLRAQGAVQALKPCLMMGPQAVAQFLDPSGMKFDLVIMDEASQLRPEEAIGAIARGRQLVVVGDPKQLPPTTFFARQNLAGDPQRNRPRCWPVLLRQGSRRSAAVGQCHHLPFKLHVYRVLLDAISNTSMTNIGVSTKAGQLRIGVPIHS